jgi:hypothetical protein
MPANDASDPVDPHEILVGLPAILPVLPEVLQEELS